MRDTIFCKHYRAMSDNKTCNASVAYDAFNGLLFDQRPCFMRSGVVCGGCDKQEFPTPAEIAVEDAEFQKLFERTNIARKAIVDHLGGPWKCGMKGSAGTIDCPVCKVEKSLRFSRSGYNGHIHAACKTENCVSWME